MNMIMKVILIIFIILMVVLHINTLQLQDCINEYKLLQLFTNNLTIIF